MNPGKIAQMGVFEGEGFSLLPFGGGLGEDKFAHLPDTRLSNTRQICPTDASRLF